MKNLAKFLIFLSMFLASFSAQSQSVGLVLSGGGAKGLSHIGILKALEENNIPIDYICGTSMGAIVAGLYSIGYTPDEMITLFSSKEFDSWLRGEPEYEFSSFFYRDDPAPSMFNFSLGLKKPIYPIIGKNGLKEDKKKLKLDLPVSLVNAYPMDIEFMKIFAPASKACRFDFDSLMVPFFCVSSDIAKKREFISEKGNLGAAVRASMTYPFIFRPITIDSTLLFDGGFYNNFPWEIMEKKYNPDFIIGAKCVLGDAHLDEEDIVTQVTGMMVVQTDYNIPPDKGIIIGDVYPYGVMDFKRVKEIVQMGYENALPHISAIKEKVKREETAIEKADKRARFKAKCIPMRFHRDVDISTNMYKSEKSFISRMVKNDSDSDFDFETFKRGYYRIIATGTVKTFYPSYELNADSLYNLNLKVTKASPLGISIGGNISSSSLNQGYVGFSYLRMGLKPWKISIDMNIGRFYKGGGIKWRHDIGIKPLVFYSGEFVLHQFDYYGGNQNLFTPDKMPNNVQDREGFMKFSLGTAVSLKGNLVAKLSLGIGELSYRYFFDDNYSAKDSPNKTYIDVIYPELSLEKNSWNYAIYPTEGKKHYAGIRYVFGEETYQPSVYKTDILEKPATSVVPNTINNAFKNKQRHTLLMRFYSESYYRLNKWVHLGYLVDLTLSNKQDKGNYYSTLLFMPAFQPIPHSNTLMMERYRANSYLGVGVSPIITFSKAFFLHTTFSYFQPYEQIKNLGGGKYEYSKEFPNGGFIGNAALVWQSPIGPVSFSASYYARGDYNQWYPQLNIGFLIFKNRMLR